MIPPPRSRIQRKNKSAGPFGPAPRRLATPRRSADGAILTDQKPTPRPTKPTTISLVCQFEQGPPLQMLMTLDCTRAALITS
jgi:hypothetical protein